MSSGSEAGSRPKRTRLRWTVALDSTTGRKRRNHRIPPSAANAAPAHPPSTRGRSSTAPGTEKASRPRRRIRGRRLRLPPAQLAPFLLAAQVRVARELRHRFLDLLVPHGPFGRSGTRAAGASACGAAVGTASNAAAIAARKRARRASAIDSIGIRPPHEKDRATSPQHAPAPINFADGVIQAADEKKASIAAAITSITAEPETITLVSRAARSKRRRAAHAARLPTRRARP